MFKSSIANLVFAPPISVMLCTTASATAVLATACACSAFIPEACIVDAIFAPASDRFFVPAMVSEICDCKSSAFSPATEVSIAEEAFCSPLLKAISPNWIEATVFPATAVPTVAPVNMLFTLTLPVAK